jgi:hypothetical protein
MAAQSYRSRLISLCPGWTGANDTRHAMTIKLADFHGRGQSSDPSRRGQAPCRIRTGATIAYGPAAAGSDGQSVRSYHLFGGTKTDNIPVRVCLDPTLRIPRPVARNTRLARLDASACTCSSVAHDRQHQNVPFASDPPNGSNGWKAAAPRLLAGVRYQLAGSYVAERGGDARLAPIRKHASGLVAVIRSSI